MKQYRLKITWSNGDESFITDASKANIEALHHHMNEGSTICLNESLINLKLVRTINKEEVCAEASEKF